MAQVLVGTPQLAGKLANYAERFSMAEVRPVDSALPAGKKLRAWRDKVPPSFAFSVVLPRCVAALTPGSEFEQGLGVAFDAARQLEARVVMLVTPASLRPTSRNRSRIVDLGQRIVAYGHLLAWQPEGLWEREDVVATARDAHMMPVFAAAQEQLASGAVVYTRIRALGATQRAGAELVARVAAQLSERREAFVVADQALAGTLSSQLPALVSRERIAQAPMLFKPSGNALLVDAGDEEQ